MKLPQLSLRDLFWLVALIAMGCGWWVERCVRIAAESESRNFKLEANRHQEQLNALMNAADPRVEGLRPLGPLV
jgi:hypothetical protein